MNAIIAERQLTPEQEEELELRHAAPQKFEPDFNPELEFKLNRKVADPKKSTGSRTYTREETAELLAASNAPCAQLETRPPMTYPTYSREQVQDLMREHYEYLDNEKKKKQEREQWDSQKTTELDTKTEPRTTPSKSMKD